MLSQGEIPALLPRQTSTLQVGFTGKEEKEHGKTGGPQTGISRHVRLCNCLPTQDSQRGTG